MPQPRRGSTANLYRRDAPVELVAALPLPDVIPETLTLEGAVYRWIGLQPFTIAHDSDWHYSFGQVERSGA